MKGIIFTTLNKLIEEKFGFEVWDRIIDQVKPKSEGAYTTAETYPDEEAFALVGALSKITGVGIPDLIHAFGEYALLAFSKAYPEFFQKKDLKEFLKSIHGVIHVEVRKLHPGAQLPDFEYEDPAADRLVMTYRSTRKLCGLAEGLMDGAAKYFNTKIERKHTRCLHRGDDHCRFEIQFLNLNGNAPYAGS